MIFLWIAKHKAREEYKTEKKTGKKKILFYYECYCVFQDFSMLVLISEINVEAALVLEVNNK